MSDNLPARSESNIYRLIELAIAFGQGSGPILLEPAAAQRLDELYGSAVTEHSAEAWTRDRMRAFEWARVLGRLAAAASIARGGALIKTEDVMTAQGAASNAEELPLGRCPFC